MTMLCVIGILNPLAICCTLPGYYCAASVSHCMLEYSVTLHLLLFLSPHSATVIERLLGELDVHFYFSQQRY